MKLSEKILNTDFEEVKLGFVGGKMGYLAKEVDAHLQTVSLEIEKLEKDNSKLLRQNEMLEASKKSTTEVKLDKVMSMEDVQAKEDELEQQASEISLMKESFERMLVVAQQEAAMIKEKARLEVEQLYNDAQKDARMIVDRAREVERDSETQIQEKLEAAQREVFIMAEAYEDIKIKLANVYENIGAEVIRLQSEEVRNIG